MASTIPDPERIDRLRGSAPVALSSYAHDRHGGDRIDEAWLDAAWSQPSTRVLPIAGNQMLTEDGAPTWVAPADLGEIVETSDLPVRVLLGERKEVTYFAAVVPPERVREHVDASRWQGLRAVLPAVLADGTAPLTFHAMGLAEWLWVTRFCPRCGAPLRVAHAGHVLVCTAEACGRQQFPRTDPAVIMIVTDGEPGSATERCLLGNSPAWPAGRYSTLAGFVEPGETFEDAVRREVAEETGVRVGEVTYFGNQPWPLPASVMIGFTAHLAAVDGADDIHVDEAEITDARWFTRAEISAGLADGSLALPGPVSISHALIEHWFGAPLDSSW